MQQTTSYSLMPRRPKPTKIMGENQMNSEAPAGTGPGSYVQFISRHQNEADILD